jgi:flagellar basal-body rod modification protein FlgD
MQGIGGEKMQIKTDWASRPSARPEKEAPMVPSTGVGQQLNEMAGTTSLSDPHAITKKKTLDKDAFLKMFMTQLKYQDPTSPVDNEKMAQQMAMFSQLEQSVTTNQYLEKMLARQDDQSALAFSMIGKTVGVDKAALFHTKMEASVFSFNLPRDAAELKVDIIDEAGETVKTLPLSRRNEGDVNIRWDGSTNDGNVAPSGRYFYRVDAKDLNSTPIEISSKVEGRVTGITRAAGETFLLVGDQKVRINEVNSVREAAVEPSKALQADNNSPGMNTVSNNGQDANATKSHDSKEGPQINIAESVRDALKSSDGGGQKMNPLMPLFMR